MSEQHCASREDNSPLKLVEAYFAAREADTSGEYAIEFECPICGGTAKGATESSMGHIRIQCQKCGTSIMS